MLPQLQTFRIHVQAQTKPNESKGLNNLLTFFDFLNKEICKLFVIKIDLRTI